MNFLPSRLSAIRKIFPFYQLLSAKNGQTHIFHKQVACFGQSIKDIFAKISDQERKNSQTVQKSTKVKKQANTSKQPNQPKAYNPSSKSFREVIPRDNEYDDSDRQIQRRKPNLNQPRQMREFFSLDQDEKLNAIQVFKRKQKIRELSMIAKQLLFEHDKSRSEVIWCALQEAFLTLLEPTQDQTKIRSLSKFLYSLGKSKRATRNYQTQMALLLPFSSHQSFTQIVTAISRMGGMSEEFGHIVEKLYWKRREEFSPLQMNLINYVLAKNGKKIDAQLVQKVNSFPLRSIVLMLRAYDESDMMTPEILKKCISAIVSRKNQTNFLDFRGILNIYSKYLCLDDKRIIEYFEEEYKILARNINEEALEEIWEYFPKAVNANKFQVAFVQQVIKSLKILRTKNRMSERTWKKIQLTFGDFQNLEIRTQLQKI